MTAKDLIAKNLSQVKLDNFLGVQFDCRLVVAHCPKKRRFKASRRIFYKFHHTNEKHWLANALPTNHRF
jgi:hypothetical protein